MSLKKVKEILEKFIEQGYVYYDYDTEEICVCDYFRLHPPVGGLNYEMFKSDLERIHSQAVIDKLVECSKKYEISPTFFAALQDIVPQIREEDFKIKGKTRSIEEYRTAAKRGRNKIAEKTKPKTNEWDMDEDMPF